MGIGAGKIVYLHLGGENDRLEFVMTGPPVEQAADAGETAKTSQVYISKEAFNFCPTLKVQKKKKYKVLCFWFC